MTPGLMYAIDDSCFYDGAELRAKLSRHRKQHGEAATMNLAVIEVTEGGNTGRRLGVGQFLLPLHRVDFHSEPGWGGDNARLTKLRSTVEASTLMQSTVRVEPTRNEVVVEFDVEARGLADASDVGLRELRQVLDAAGVSFPTPVSGATSSPP